MPVRYWLMAARPRTLAAGAVPVAIGTALASDLVRVDWLAASACLTGALLIQIATNFANDAFDGIKGADGPDRIGPTRAVASGSISARAMIIAAAITSAAAFAIGLYLAMLGGWPILALGIVSIICAFAYTGGPFPLAYHGLGDLFVLLFFGLFAVLGSGWVQIARDFAGIPPWWWLVAIAVGLQATAIIAVNNVRDRSGDERVGKRTVCVRLGEHGSRIYYGLIHLGAAGAWWAAATLHGSVALIAAAIIATAAGIKLTLGVRGAIGPALNRYIGQSAAAEFATALAYVVARIIGHAGAH
jgi:1,4-dihydroxy-2-naphthoate polyprenyltransferase